MIGFSPKGALEAFLVFPVMLIIALTIDILGIVLICFRLDDFGILDIIGLVIFGTWVFVRSGGEKNLKDQKSLSTTKEKSAAIKKQGTTLLKRLGRVGLRAGIISIFEFIPYVGAILFGWTIVVAIEFFSDVQSFSMETGE